MATNSVEKNCSKCEKGTAACQCSGCEQWLCLRHFDEHRRDMEQIMDEVCRDRNLLQEELAKDHYRQHPILASIQRWEETAIQTIRSAADEVRMKFRTYMEQTKTDLNTSLEQMGQSLSTSRDTKIYVERQLNQWSEELKQVQEQLKRLLAVDIDSNAEADRHLKIIRLPDFDQSLRKEKDQSSTKWDQNASTIAGSHSYGDHRRQLNQPFSMTIDGEGTLFIADCQNHRVVAWTKNAKEGIVVAGGKRGGNRLDQLYHPTSVVFDWQARSLTISDSGNRRIIRWPCWNGSQGEVLLSDIESYGLAIDEQQSLYVSDYQKHEVRRYRRNEIVGVVVAGGHGRGEGLHQLAHPCNLFVDHERSVYVSDSLNHRVVKWKENAREGTVVAGGHQRSETSNQLSCPRGIVMDKQGFIYIADQSNHRIMRWFQAAGEGTVIAGGNGQGSSGHQLRNPWDLCFDKEQNLYVLDTCNHRVQKFAIRQKRSLFISVSHLPK